MMVERDANGRPVIEDLPFGMNERERCCFAFNVMTQRSLEDLYPYLSAAIATAPNMEASKQWYSILQLINHWYGGDIIPEEIGSCQCGFCDADGRTVN